MVEPAQLHPPGLGTFLQGFRRGSRPHLRLSWVVCLDLNQRTSKLPEEDCVGLGIVRVKGKKRLERHETSWPGKMHSMCYHGHKNSRTLVNFQYPILSLSSKRFPQTFGASYTEPSNLAQLFILVQQALVPTQHLEVLVCFTEICTCVQGHVANKKKH